MHRQEWERKKKKPPPKIKKGKNDRKGTHGMGEQCSQKGRRVGDGRRAERQGKARHNLLRKRVRFVHNLFFLVLGEAGRRI